jgi:acetyl esterase/lipase
MIANQSNMWPSKTEGIAVRRDCKRCLWVFVIILLISASHSATADAPKEMLLWPPEHPANQGDEPRTVDSPEWTERVTKSPMLTPFLPEPGKGSGAAIVICPGGGYSGLAMQKEGLDTAKWFQSQGVAAIVLRYRCGGGKNQQPVPLEDAHRAIRTVRARANEWGVDPQRVGILGYSAGGHLASTAATMFDEGQPDAADPIERQSCRPDFAVLIYPVISMEDSVTHSGSRKNLLGENPDKKLVEHWSTYRQVSDKTPPTFLVHASDDKAVPVKNALLFYQALVDHGVPAELHVFEEGGHGFGMLRGERPADHWPEQLTPWLQKHGVIHSGN